MVTAVVPVSDNALAAADAQRLGARLAAMPTRTLVLGALGVVVLVALLVGMALSLGKTEYRMLFSNLGEKDGAAVIAKLDQMGVDYRFADGGGSILVPASRVYELRMKLSAAGVNKGSISGYELLDGANSFGQSDGQQRVQLKRALEGELTRTIQSLSSVQAARVMLSIPQQNGFFREQQKATASVTVQLHPGHALEREQVAGIVHLVASSVPELQTRAVSVLDGNGALLWPQDEREGSAGFDSAQLRYLREVENGYLKRVMELLEPVVGRENLRATVTAEVDFTQQESTAEEFKPNQGDAPAAVRAQRTEESSQADPARPSGVPGAASNQPPVPATAAMSGASAPLQGAKSAIGAGNARREAETSYAVDKTVRVTRNASGTVRRLHAAVVVNHHNGTDAKGKPTSTPLSEEEMQKLTALVQQGIGFNQGRGDSVRVVNAPFRIETAPPAAAQPFYLQPWLHDLLRAGMAPAALALVALVIVFGLIRPAMKAATVRPHEPATVGTQLDAVVADDDRLPGPEEVQAALALDAKVSGKLHSARLLARENPGVVANVVRNWVSGGDPA
ncbi:MAG: flagellar M-ring protein FliF [Rubrivivax sp. SCN 71-131]|jgi:flagellar M-ring protein FliF|nr:MAG: flagellar M-ring protein FliF [Rubrivivax sp. SCN 71-131]